MPCAETQPESYGNQQCEAKGAYDDSRGLARGGWENPIRGGAFCLPEADNCGVHGGKGKKSDG